MQDGPESQTYTRLRRDALAERAFDQPPATPPRPRRGRLWIALLGVAVLLGIAKLAGLV